ncbi:MAG TPA: hypothetical protein VFS61_06900 [Anaerolineales bacterium]|nr:hypothetical protein [Anaerolineales bacterium]
MAQRINLLCEDLYMLYFEKHLTFAEIARQFGCSPVTVHKRLRACGFQARPAGGSVFEYPKKNFDGGLCEQAYLIGLRLGDLHGEKGNRAIRIRCTSTHQEQIDLIHDLFSDSGGVWISKPYARRGTAITVHLNGSFNFLLPHDPSIKEWNLGDDSFFAAFWAGYVDAEGSFIVARGRACFKVDSGDKEILYQAWTRLGQMGIVFPEPRLVRPAGTWIKQFQLASHHDLWRLATERKETLIQLCNILSPYLRHRKRIEAMEAARANVASRISN